MFMLKGFESEYIVTVHLQLYVVVTVLIYKILGGSILIVCRIFDNKGRIEALGGNSTMISDSVYMKGGNGRIAVYTDNIIDKGYIIPKCYYGCYNDGLKIIDGIKKDKDKYIMYTCLSSET